MVKNCKSITEIFLIVLFLYIPTHIYSQDRTESDIIELTASFSCTQSRIGDTIALKLVFKNKTDRSVNINIRTLCLSRISNDDFVFGNNNSLFFDSFKRNRQLSIAGAKSVNETHFIFVDSNIASTGENEYYVLAILSLEIGIIKISSQKLKINVLDFHK